ncbi:MAG: hypothetical protein ABIJ09_00745 [Pseudomonadota bacterium]
MAGGAHSIAQLWQRILGDPSGEARLHTVLEWLNTQATAEQCDDLVVHLEDAAFSSGDGDSLRALVQAAAASGRLSYDAVERLYLAAVQLGDDLLSERLLGLQHGPAAIRHQVEPEDPRSQPEQPPDDETRLALQELLTLLRALSEFTQRTAVLSEWMDRLGAERVVRVLGAALYAIGEGQGDARIAVDVFHAVMVGEQLSYEHRARLYEEAVTQGRIGVQRLVLAPPAQEIDTQGHDPKGSLAAKGQPLGMRTWLARRAGRDLIDRLLLDPDASVVANLLLNPMLTESDVLRIASRRPNRPDVLLELSQAPRWNRRYALRRALVFNPYTPVDLALRQVPFLTRADLLSVAGDAKLHQEVRDGARALAHKRPPTRV